MTLVISQHVNSANLVSTARSTSSSAVDRDGETIDFDVLYREQRSRVLATVRTVIGASDEIEDVVQLVFIEVYRCLPRFEGRSKLSTWVYRIAVNVALQHVRKKKRKRWLSLGAKGDEDTRYPDKVDEVRRLEDREALEVVHRATKKLSEKKRIVWQLHELQGLPPQEIADILGIPMNTVRSRLLAARRELMAEVKRLMRGTRA